MRLARTVPVQYAAGRAPYSTFALAGFSSSMRDLSKGLRHFLTSVIESVKLHAATI